MISIFNYSLRGLIIYFVKKIGYDSLTKEISLIRFFIAKVSVFNKCVLIILTTANFEFTDYAFNGTFSDFNKKWYKTNGIIIVSTMLISTFFPLITISLEYFQDYCWRAYDQGTLRPLHFPITTKCKTIAEYMSWYSGPEFLIHYKYAELETICVICLLYGPGIPMLFPLGLLNLCIIFVIERFALAKFYKMPPKYSEEITNSTIRTLIWIPLLYFMCGFWMFSNR